MERFDNIHGWVASDRKTEAGLVSSIPVTTPNIQSQEGKTIDNNSSRSVASQDVGIAQRKLGDVSGYPDTYFYEHNWRKERLTLEGCYDERGAR